jgi:hypothetical protein
MNPFKQLLDKVKNAYRHNLTYRQLFCIWRGRKEFIQIVKNFRKLEGSWLRGIKKSMSILMP